MNLYADWILNEQKKVLKHQGTAFGKWVCVASHNERLVNYDVFKEKIISILYSKRVSDCNNSTPLQLNFIIIRICLLQNAISSFKDKYQDKKPSAKPKLKK